MEENKINTEHLKQILWERTERLKELAAINQTVSIIKEGKSIDETLQKICLLLPNAWQYPEHTVVRIIFDNKEFKSLKFRTTPWCMSQSFNTVSKKTGSIEVYYTQEFPDFDEGPFLKEERALIENISGIITGFLDRYEAKRMLDKNAKPDIPPPVERTELTRSQMSRKLLQQYLNKRSYERDIFHDLMPFKVKEILIVATLYDAFTIEKEGRFSQHILGEYHQLNLTSIPRITGVTTLEEAMELLERKHFDLVILMIGVDMTSPIEISKAIKNKYPYIPVYLMLNNNMHLATLEEQREKLVSVDRMFVWNGDPKIFFAMIKLLEDSINLENDVKIGLVKIILLVEDSAQYYSRFLPMLYSLVLEQTQRIIEDVSTDELYKVLKLRARPKIIFVSNYEDAVEIFDKYKNNMLCVISDVRFPSKQSNGAQSGINLIKYIKEKNKNLPVILQSSEPEYQKQAFKLGAVFINKNSETLLQDIKSFITYYLGFGNFIYRDQYGKQLVVARSLQEFVNHLKKIPDESIVYHGMKNHFSLWLMARGEIDLAKELASRTVDDFVDISEARKYLIEIIEQYRSEKNRGRVIPFEEEAITDETNITSLASGSLGGKGRGLAFISSLIFNFDFSQLIPDITITAPKTMIIGTDEFTLFTERYNIHEFVFKEKNYQKIRKKFLTFNLSDELVKRLKIMLKHITKPLAIRSSSLFEDSLMQPFSGIFETYIIPNNHSDIEVRLQQLIDAIRLVFSSIYSDKARAYFKAVNFKIEEEKMAVIIQELVGNQYGNYYYPHISGVAQSYNFYPIAHMKPDEGFAVAALGLGSYVVDGEKAFRFSMHYPNLEINSPKDAYKNSQTYFYAVNLKQHSIDFLAGEDAGLIKLDISEAEQHGNLKHIASVYDADNERIIPGITDSGPRVINFANILKYNYIPLAETLKVMLDVVKEAMGVPVEIEFAVDLTKDANNKASFYLLQVKPMLGKNEDYSITDEDLIKQNLILYAEKGMGNGVVQNICDVIYVDHNVFDKTLTPDIAQEVEELNTIMVNENKRYVLIGPGRWGTRDRFIGIPVTWPQISNAAVIVETSFEGFVIDASLGSHFFHNVTSRNIGYFSVQNNSEGFIDWDILTKQPVINKTNYLRHIQFSSPLIIKMDGKKQIAVIRLA